MTAFYNEIDNYAADWLENLIAAGEIAPGIVDRRPIQEIEAYELAGFTQCHFFAGIGVWSGALRAAGWVDDRPIWTGSCPCQPFSAAGKQKGFSDERHLWPAWFNLIAQQKPDVIVGEQVASALQWLDLVSADLEAQNYAFGASDLCAAGFDGAHIRQRLYFAGLQYAESNGREQWRAKPSERTIVRCKSDGLANDDDDAGSQGWELRGGRRNQRPVRPASLVVGLADDDEQQWNRCGDGRQGRRGEFADSGEIIWTDAPMLGRQTVDWLYCRDGKWRPVEPGTFPLVDACPDRVGKLRAYGNALDFETAKNFCIAVKEICDGV